MRRIISFALKNRKIHGYLRRLYDESLTRAKVELEVETDVPEAIPLQARKSSFNEYRLNLIVPALATQHVFGGIATALSFLKSISANTANIRIILTEQAIFSPVDNPDYSSWEVATLNDEDAGGFRIVPAADRYKKTLAIGKNDHFIATAWWTAVSARALQSAQMELFSLSGKRKFIYLIQDYEPGFYPWSSRYALAESTYRNSNEFIAVFNTSILRDFFLRSGYSFPKQHYFEPVLHERLRVFLNTPDIIRRRRKILIYGRPTVERNAFPIIIMALRQWITDYSPENWEFVSAGETHAAIDLGSGNRLISLGKLSIDEYAHELQTSYLGISLMISPHPSYPPLEMAAFGLQVITNNYGSKDLSTLASNIHSIEWASPESLSRKIEEITEKFDDNYCKSNSGVEPNSFFDNFCSQKNPFLSISQTIISDVLLR